MILAAQDLLDHPAPLDHKVHKVQEESLDRLGTQAHQDNKGLQDQEDLLAHVEIQETLVLWVQLVLLDQQDHWVHLDQLEFQGHLDQRDQLAFKGPQEAGEILDLLDHLDS